MRNVWRQLLSYSSQASWTRRQIWWRCDRQEVMYRLCFRFANLNWFYNFFFRSYSSGATIPVEVRIVANHNGFFEFHLCNMDRYGRETEECYSDNQLLFGDGSQQQQIGSFLGNHNLQVRLPAGVRCNHCVLRWTYTAGMLNLFFFLFIFY